MSSTKSNQDRRAWKAYQKPGAYGYGAEFVVVLGYVRQGHVPTIAVLEWVALIFWDNLLQV